MQSWNVRRSVSGVGSAICTSRRIENFTGAPKCYRPLASLRRLGVDTSILDRQQPRDLEHHAVGKRLDRLGRGLAGRGMERRCHPHVDSTPPQAGDRPGDVLLPVDDDRKNRGAAAIGEVRYASEAPLQPSLRPDALWRQPQDTTTA